MRSAIQHRVLCFVGAMLLIATVALAEDRPRELVDQAWAKIAAGEFHEARGKFDLAANIATDFSVKAEAAAWRGFASNRIGATKVAEEDFAEAEKFAQEAGKDLNKSLVFVLRARARSVSHLDHQLPIAAKHLTAAAQLTPDDQSVQLELGDRLLTAQIKYEIGKVYYSLALNVQFQLPVTGRGPGSVPNGGLLPAAIKHISEALEIEPHSFEYYADRGLCHYGRSDWAKADAVFKAYLTANPNKLDYLKQRIAWWTDLHRRWDASNEQMVRQLEEFNRRHRWYLDNSDYCSACDRRVMKGESHSHN